MNEDVARHANTLDCLLIAAREQLADLDYDGVAATLEDLRLEYTALRTAEAARPLVETVR